MKNLGGKRILFLGSSVTYGSASGGVSFVDFLKEEHGCEVVKEAVSGTTLVDNGPDSYVARMKTMPADVRADLFVCQLSTNDARLNLPLGAFDGREDTSTIAGAMEHIIRYARETWRCPVAFYTNPKYESANYESMIALLNECAGKYGVHIIDLWNDPAVNNLSGEYMADPVHPTYLGYKERWTPVFARRIGEILEA